MTDGNEHAGAQGGQNTRVPATVSDEAMADVHATEVCDGAGDSECVREDPELIRGEDEIHVTNYGPGSDRNGRRVLCGECSDKQTALNIADDPALGKLYADKLPDLRERFPDILGDVDVPVTDGGEELEQVDMGELIGSTVYHGGEWWTFEHADSPGPTVALSPAESPLDTDPVREVMNLARVFYEREQTERQRARDAEGSDSAVLADRLADANAEAANELRELAKYLDGERERPPRIIYGAKLAKGDGVPWRSGGDSA